MMMARKPGCVLGLYALLVSQSTLPDISGDLRRGRLGFPPISSGVSCDGLEHGFIDGMDTAWGYCDHNEINVEKE